MPAKELNHKFTNFNEDYEHTESETENFEYFWFVLISTLKGIVIITFTKPLVYFYYASWYRQTPDPELEFSHHRQKQILD